MSNGASEPQPSNTLPQDDTKPSPEAAAARVTEETKPAPKPDATKPPTTRRTYGERFTAFFFEKRQ